MSKVIPFQYVDCPRCADLERQLAEAQEEIDGYRTTARNAVADWQEAQGKLLRYGDHASDCQRIEARPHMHRGVDCYEPHPCDCGWVEWRDRARILKGE